VITDIHKEYLEAGADVISLNTFGANRLKFAEDELRAVIDAAIDCGEKARERFENKYLALDIGPLGRLLAPFGDLSFEEAYDIFAETIKIANDRTDLIIIETMNDSYETKAAVLAAKENSNLPIFVSNVFDENRKFNRLVTNPEEHRLEEGESIRLEMGTYSEIMKVKALVDSTIAPTSRGCILYHLDDENLNRYKSHEIENIYN
jgi:methionine synthase I (cobalamin-dependent)